MILVLVLRILMLVLPLGTLLTAVLAATPPYQVAIRTCVDTCGDISIPFPFGLGDPGCFLDEWYEIVCANNTTPRLKKLDLEVLNISLPQRNFNSDSTITVSYPIAYANSSCQHNGIRDPPTIAGSPFTFSAEWNIFVAVGCDNVAIMGSSNPSFVGCRTQCTGTTNTRQYSNCSGYDCCYSTIPSGLQSYTVDFQNDNSVATGYRDCQLAFLVQYSGFKLNGSDNIYALPSGDYVPVVLDWGITNASFLKISLGFPIDPNYTDSSMPSYCRAVAYINDSNTPLIECQCNYGYYGNPYLRGGCLDINECEDPANRCRDNCRNMPGYYHCVRPKRTVIFLIIGLCSGFGSLLLIFLSWWIYKIIKKRKEAKRKEKFFKRNGGLILQQQLSSPQGNIEKSKVFSIKELEKATDHFNKDRILGQGGQGTVYKGMLTDGRIVAIKKSFSIDESDVEHFINEVVILSQINHRNVVKLLGCCLESEVPLLVYEFIPNGTLYRYLHDPSEEFPVSWEVRLRVATEIASALSYLHSSASMPIYHRDIKTTNILLDEKYRAKIADFGTSRSVSLEQTHVTTLVQGTFGYLDPEYFQSSQFTDKSDVYSFGVVLVELLTGQKPVSSLRANEGRSLATYFIISMEENRLFDILDAQVPKQGEKDEIIAVANLARRCLNLKGRKRPTMREVILELEGIKRQELPASNLQKEQEHDEDLEAMMFEAHDAAVTSRVSNADADVVSLSDIYPLLPTESLTKDY